MRPIVFRTSVILMTFLTFTIAATAQSSSLRKGFAANAGEDSNLDSAAASIELTSLIAVKPPEPEKFRVHDLITVIVRHQKSFESDADLNSKNEFEIESKLDEFIKFIGGGVGAAAFRRGQPNIGYSFESESKKDVDTSREDRMTTRITAEVVDVKPNGNLVVMARQRIRNGAEVSFMTLTGTCSSKDISPERTVLSSQIFDLDISDVPEGPTEEGTRKGRIPKLLDKIRLF